ncbi:hypothetical protein C0995_015854 [Termitomyces sp. Mi166|nr:hypothetical protein C0995_015854 [Termitomyces sp. Mi166\
MTSYKAPPRSSAEISDPTSEPGLAEWTSKIKAMQRQVDADDEAEQMRLEQEIAASRMARKRRSQGLGSASRTSLDASRVDADQSDPTTISKIPSKLQALQIPKGLPATATSPSTLAQDLKNSSSSKPQSMSLAAFMGGSATGPRLRKHAPQQDAHDPTQFDQRAFDRTPHPAFGTGGVALPGIAVQRDGSMKPSAIAALAKTTLASTSSGATLASRGNSETHYKSPVTHNMDARERATSFPSSSSSTSRSSAKPTSYNQERIHESTQLSTSDQITRVHSVSPVLSRSTPVAPTKPSRLPTDETPSPSRSLYAAPPLAGPIRPQPRPSVSGPQMLHSVTTSKAFTRQPVQKELTPSLSRLQGRGFVQKVSSRLESPQTMIPETPEKSTPVNGKRTGSILDRWQPNASQNTPSPSPAPRAVRRSTTFGPSKDDSRQFPSIDHEKKTLREAASQPSLRQENIPPRPPSSSSKSNGVEKPLAIGLGSATTLVVYKPTPAETPSIDEFGVKPNGASRGSILDFPAPSKPLSHPTKERARKPQKRTVSGATTNPAKNIISSMDALQVSTIVTSGNPPVSLPSTGLIALPPHLQGQSSQVTEDTSQLSKMDTDELQQNPSDLLDSRPVSTSKPKTKPMTHPGDAPTLVRRGLPGLSASKTFVSHVQNPEIIDHGLARPALPGLSPLNAADQQRPLRSPVLGKESSAGVTSSLNPSRILSTGNRPTVIDVAQALNESAHARHAEQPIALPEPPQSVASSQLRSLVPSQGHAERRLSYEKYSSIILPPLKEEATPVPTPTGTLSRKNADIRPDDALQGEVKIQPVSETSGILFLAISQVSIRNVPFIQAPLLPHVNFDSLLKYNLRHHYDPGTITISVEVMSITGTTASPLTRDQTIFYDTELLAIVHRSKSQLSGLVSTSVWSWEGKRTVLGPREQRKLQEIGQRYGTSVIVAQQNSEPPQLVYILGGVLAIRQGSRTHWTPENTAMHLVRSLGGVVYVDEKDLSTRNLCSGYSYCISILDSVYVWYGRGSTPLEKKAALEYGRSLATASPPTELTEDTSKNDEMFWMILGEDEYANADYWKWRRNSSHIDPRIWRVRADLDKDCVTAVDCISNETSLHKSIYVIDCIWEFYVVVGSDARAQKQDIELAINVASELSTRVSLTRPYAPTVHTLILPSQIPRDLRATFRDLDEFSVVCIVLGAYDTHS